MTQFSKFVYNKDAIVIGGDLRALMYAYSNELPVIFTKPKPPFRFSPLQEGFESLGRGTSTQLQAWERLVFILGLAGQLPVSDMVDTLRIEEDVLKVVTKGSRMAKFKFNKLIIFDDERIFGLPEVCEEHINPNRVVDWYAVRSGCRHDVDTLSSKEAFLREVIFYPSDRFDGTTTLKDAVSVSYLTDKELGSFEFSETYARFKLTHMMKEAGIRGARNGRIKEKPGKYRYYALKVEHINREIHQDVRRVYAPDAHGRLVFNNRTLEEVLGQLPHPTGYASKLCNMVFI